MILPRRGAARSGACGLLIPSQVITTAKRMTGMTNFKPKAKLKPSPPLILLPPAPCPPPRIGPNNVMLKIRPMSQPRACHSGGSSQFWRWVANIGEILKTSTSLACVMTSLSVGQNLTLWSPGPSRPLPTGAGSLSTMSSGRQSKSLESPAGLLPTTSCTGEPVTSACWSVRRYWGKDRAGGYVDATCFDSNIYIDLCPGWAGEGFCTNEVRCSHPYPLDLGPHRE